MRTSVMHVVPHRPPGTEYGAKIAFHKELNTTPPKYMLRHAQTNQQKLLNLEPTNFSFHFVFLFAELKWDQTGQLLNFHGDSSLTSGFSANSKRKQAQTVLDRVVSGQWTRP